MKKQILYILTLFISLLVFEGKAQNNNDTSEVETRNTRISLSVYTNYNDLTNAFSESKANNKYQKNYNPSSDSSTSESTFDNFIESIEKGDQHTLPSPKGNYVVSPLNEKNDYSPNGNDPAALVVGLVVGSIGLISDVVDKNKKPKKKKKKVKPVKGDPLHLLPTK